MHFSVSFDDAQTDTPIIAGAQGKKLVVTRYHVALANGVQADTSIVLGFGLTTLTSLFAGHPGMVPGSQFGESFGRNAEVSSELGHSLLFTCSQPTNGTVKVSGSYEIHDFRKNPT